MLILLFPLLIQDEPVRALIERLGSDSVEEREHATAALRRRVDDAPEELEKAARSADPEIAGRALEILRTPTPHRLEVAGAMAHLFDHALWAFQKRRAGECLSLCDAMLLIDARCALALELGEAVRQDFAGRPLEGDFSSLRVPPRAAWPPLRKRIRETALVGIDVPDDGSRCPLAVRCRLQSQKADLDFENAAIEDVIRLVQDLSGANVVLDAGVEPRCDLDKRLSYRSKDQPLGESLGELLSQADMEYVITREGVILVRFSPDKDPDRY